MLEIDELKSAWAILQSLKMQDMEMAKCPVFLVDDAEN